ncbi:fluoride efflux transporter CrcB [Neobacillus mesonae]|uniref:fluoride efflux transporter CrcB n=1 Tax=Neobacillus mesonae TaxID=1193713 RepID=UPI00204201FE|nr:fluoride efflux transporter CrcB [Neobacillus mesonae]MCM3569484.1 fluoride efflux transporter CrcB [Neobacillus mesonae]
MLFVGVGGIFGAISRFLLGKWIGGRMPGFIPFGTWIINISGSFVLGLLASLHLKDAVPEWAWFLFGTGFLGAYTTFSTFGYETIQMLKINKKKNAIFYVTSSVLLGVLFAWIGSFVANAFIVQ